MFFQNIRELVNTVRTEIGALIDADRNNVKEESNQNINLSALKKNTKSKKGDQHLPILHDTNKFCLEKQLEPSTPIKSTTESSNNDCCCNFLHCSYSFINCHFNKSNSSRFPSTSHA